MSSKNTYRLPKPEARDASSRPFPSVGVVHCDPEPVEALADELTKCRGGWCKSFDNLDESGMVVALTGWHPVGDRRRKDALYVRADKDELLELLLLLQPPSAASDQQALQEKSLSYGRPQPYVWHPVRPRSPRWDPSHPSLAVSMPEAHSKACGTCKTLLHSLGYRFGISGSGINGSGILPKHLLFEDPSMGWVQLDPINLAAEWAGGVSFGQGWLESL